ncbi:hypothetical protein ACELLULO517_09805 [Acidisoma cellulosilytica]|uniref:Uncharacterized protein n=1 Tax=Acidisoma cellulosilyticum TaxID=2802395 RepID=A0A963Z0Y3_9PROT|nr:hypothetical protein [Acidisoma cellulosilyticum]MCB8880526.1 hypothetical protein [Acidisoma cellulosilyticum]
MTDIYEKGSQAEQLALWTIRCAKRGPGAPFSVWMTAHQDHWRDLHAISTLFRDINWTVAEQRGIGLDIAPPGQVWTTLEERHLLRAAAAAQAEDDAILAELAATLSPHPALVPAIADAAAMLGAVLATHGYWLPKPESECSRLPGPALSVARRRSAVWDRADVMWP